MKRTIRITTFILAFSLLLFSCQEMEMEQGLGVDDELMWENPSYVNQYMVDLISMMPNGFNPSGFSQGVLYAGATDEAENANPSASIQDFNSGNWNSVSGPEQIWDKYYHGIYKVNLFLEKASHITYETYAPEQRNLFLNSLEKYKAEARFLRALYYYELMKRFGGVVLVGDAFVEDFDDLSKPEFREGRSSLAESVDYIVGECDTIIDNHMLPLLDEGADQGRPNGTAAKALKCKALTFKASPVYNSSITEGSAEQEEVWEQVLLTAQDIAFDRIFSFGPYDLYDGTSPEVILGHRVKNIGYLERVNFPVGSEGVNTTGSTNPTQDLVDSYRMLSGMAIDEPGSGYDPENPYEGRDHRLHQTVLFNGSEWNERNVEPRTIEIYRGGRDGMDRQYGTKTGYYLKKFIDPTLDLRQGQGSNREWPIFRFADIVLIWAEAANELYGPTTRGESYLTATTILNQTITRHGGLPELPLHGISQEEFRERIREERFIELAFENKRAWDLRRWGLATEVLNEPVHKMEVTMNADSTMNYERQMLEDRYFEQRMNLYPIPQRAVNNGLEQNPGW